MRNFYIPKIDLQKCIDRGLCEQTCPISQSEKTFHCLSEVSAAIYNNQVIRNLSSSGGMPPAITEHILSLGGKVFGAAFDDNLQLSHIKISTTWELKKLCNAS